jgi:Uma2 family endonuclease
VALAPKQLTLAEFLQLPERTPPLEYSDGEVQQKVSPKGKRIWLQTALLERINAIGVPGRVAAAAAEGRVTFAGKSRVPDITVYTWDRIPRDEVGEVADDFITPPDIAIEIVSPGQCMNAVVRRCRWYVANGVQIVLLIDPGARSVLALRPDGVTLQFSGSDSIDLAPVVPGFQLTVDELFSALTVHPAGAK